jgi:hypothetical protein
VIRLIDLINNTHLYIIILLVLIFISFLIIVLIINWQAIKTIKELKYASKILNDSAEQTYTYVVKNLDYIKDQVTKNNKR